MMFHTFLSGLWGSTTCTPWPLRTKRACESPSHATYSICSVGLSNAHTAVVPLRKFCKHNQLHPWDNPYRPEISLYIFETYKGHTTCHRNIYFIWKKRHRYKNRYHLELMKMSYQYSTRSPKWSKHATAANVCLSIFQPHIQTLHLCSAGPPCQLLMVQTGGSMMGSSPERRENGRVLSSNMVMWMAKALLGNNSVNMLYGKQQ
jgi:hypothetical protein